MDNSESPSQGRLIFRGILFIVLIGAIIYKCSSTDETPHLETFKSGAVTQEDSRISFDLENEKPDETDVYIASHHFVQDKLISPSSAEFPNLDYSVNYTENNKVYLITGFVEYKNAYNVLLKRYYSVGLQYLGGNPPVRRSWKLESFSWID